MSKTSTFGDPALQAEADVADSVAAEIGVAVPEVQAVWTERSGPILSVFSIVPARDSAVYRRIYAKEKDLMGEFQDIEFDFHVVPSYGRDPQTLIVGPRVRMAFFRK